MSSPCYLAIDGGGTNTRARLADGSGRIIGEGLSGSSNLTLGIETAGTAIAAAGDIALKAAGLGERARAFVHAGLGLAGANVPALAEAIGGFAFGYRTVAVASDAVSACLGAHGGGDGGILILGTGSQGLALVGGKSTAVGGWGFAISDEASGAILGRAALRAAILAVDALCPASDLTRAILARFHDEPARAVLWAKSATPRDYGSFAPLVFERAGRDSVADFLIADAVRSIVAMLERLTFLGAPRIALMGGLAKPYRPFIPARYDKILVQAKGDAMDGALMLARQGADAAAVNSGVTG
ncbi:N-acetylglucosamine kinase [Labrys miyagiensis]|uniref:N-acetylglucosamine kinase n=1 Tax=Labrys miyagiensis TaxID=346912 RepID=A0ABQ6CME0_9HYPH|nr:BadF/BadG/BcrA/BcrD ATPase family protein [Labrys miyagiensis]GLS20929.1 N-acetylglucosamine kinase [Labrys miyagiensis]